MFLVPIVLSHAYARMHCTFGIICSSPPVSNNMPMLSISWASGSAHSHDPVTRLINFDASPGPIPLKQKRVNFRKNSQFVHLYIFKNFIRVMSTPSSDRTPVRGPSASPSKAASKIDDDTSVHDTNQACLAFVHMRS